MITLHEVIRARRTLTEAGFPDPGLLSSAVYTFGEACEVLDLVHYDLRPRDLRARDKNARDGMDKELGQVVFMAYTTLSHCGPVMVNVEFDRLEPKYSDLVIAMQMCKDALDGMIGANNGNARIIENAMTEVIAWAYLLARRYQVDHEKAMWDWVENRRVEALRNGSRG